MPWCHARDCKYFASANVAGVNAALSILLLKGSLYDSATFGKPPRALLADTLPFNTRLLNFIALKYLLCSVKKTEGLGSKQRGAAVACKMRCSSAMRSSGLLAMLPPSSDLPSTSISYTRDSILGANNTFLVVCAFPFAVWRWSFSSTTTQPS